MTNRYPGNPQQPPAPATSSAAAPPAQQQRAFGGTLVMGSGPVDAAQLAPPQYAQPAAPQPQYAQPAAQYAQPAAQPQYAQAAAQPQYAQVAPQPQYAQAAAQPQYAPPAAPPQYAQAAATPQYAQPAAPPQPQYAPPAAPPQYAPPQAAPPHPGGLARRDVGVFGGLGINFRTMPFPVTRFFSGVLYSGLTALLMTVWLGLVVVAHLYIHVAATGVLFLAGALALVFLWLPWVQRKAFRDRCAHTAAIAEVIISGQSLSVDAARSRVDAVLGDPEQLDERLNATYARARSLVKRIGNLEGMLPFEIPGLSAASSAFTRSAMPFIGSLAIAHALRRPGTDPMATVNEALAYVGQNAKQLLKTCIWSSVCEKLLNGVVFCILFSVFGGAAWVVMGSFAPSLVQNVAAEHQALLVTALGAAATLIVGLPLTLLGSWVSRESMVRPGLTAYALARFLELTHQQPLDPSWRDRVEQLDDFAAQGKVRIPLG